MTGITSPAIYPARSIKRRRRTKREIEDMHEAMQATVARLAPMTLRQLFYALTVQGVIEKTEQDYAMVGHQLLRLRRAGVIPWAAIADNTRWVRQRQTFDGIDHALEVTAQAYRRSMMLWEPVQVEVWVEKDALAGVIMDVTSEFDVPLYCARGFSSETYIWSAAENIREDGRDCYIYEFGDHDPSGLASSRATERKLIEFVDGGIEGDQEVIFERVAVTPDQIARWGLPGRPTKREGNSHARGFEGDSVELDAIPPDLLRSLVRSCLDRHISAEALRANQVAEASERELLRAFARQAGELAR